MNRRTFVTGTMLASAGAAAAAGSLAPAGSSADEAAAGKPATTASPGDLPCGKIGDLQVSRLLLGGNLLTHYTHSRDLKYVYNLAKHYNTDQKILDTLSLAEQHGVNTLVVHNVPATMKILVEHRRRGGQMQWITCTAHALAGGDVSAFSRQIDELVDYGTDALYISGVEGDRMCGFHQGICGPDADAQSVEPRLDVLQQALFAAKAHGLPVGIGAHRLGVIEMCEQAGLDADFYVKTFHQHNYPTVDLNHDSRWCSRPDDVARFMQTVDKPWIAYKVMAAGAIAPQSAFQHAFQNGADFVLAGMFDFEIQQDVQIARQVLAGLQERARPWRA
jgi:hypothetical protein